MNAVLAMAIAVLFAVWVGMLKRQIETLHTAPLSPRSAHPASRPVKHGVAKSSLPPSERATPVHPHQSISRQGGIPTWTIG